LTSRKHPRLRFSIVILIIHQQNDTKNTALSELIKEIEPDLVIMATHGMAANFPFGSVAEKVIKNSPVPVLSINPKARE